MKGDKILIRPVYYSNAKEILTHFIDKLNKERKFIISVGGESGSGKSVTATCLKKCIEDKGFNTIILHQDDYFLLPQKQTIIIDLTISTTSVYTK